MLLSDALGLVLSGHFCEVAGLPPKGGGRMAFLEAAVRGALGTLALTRDGRVFAPGAPAALGGAAAASAACAPPPPLAAALSGALRAALISMGRIDASRAIALRDAVGLLLNPEGSFYVGVEAAAALPPKGGRVAALGAVARAAPALFSVASRADGEWVWALAAALNPEDE